MKTRNMVIGVAFILMGIALLGQNFGLFSFSLAKIAPYWPVLWILAGLFAWFDPRKQVMNGATSLLLVLSIPLLFYAYTLPEESLEMESPEVEEEERLIEPSAKVSRQNFQVPNQPGVEMASFSINSGLGSYDVKSSEKDLFSAELFGQHRQMKMTEGLENGVYEIQLTESKGSSLKNNSSDLKMNFHPHPIWDMKWEVGLGEIQLDLRQNKIRNLELSTGLAELQLKIGTRQKETQIRLKSGLADTEIDLPSSAGAEIRTESALSSFDFEGFEEVEKGIYRTANYKEANQKIWIQLESGFSSIKISRYN